MKKMIYWHIASSCWISLPKGSSQPEAFIFHEGLKPQHRAFEFSKRNLKNVVFLPKLDLEKVYFLERSCLVMH